MKRIACLVLLMLCTTFPSAIAIQDVKSEPAKLWSDVVDPDKDCRVREDGGILTITVPKTYHDLTHTDDHTKLNAPRVLQEVRGDFRLQVKVGAFPLPEADTSSSGRHSFVSAGLLVWLDDKNFVRMDRAAVGGNPAPFVWVEVFKDGKPVDQMPHPVANTDTHLEVTRRGDKLTFAASEDGKTWIEVHAVETKLPERVKAGALTINTTTKDFTSRLEGLTLDQKKE